ncbi:MAG: hypothetical protein GF344_18260 [Chitinivibrionales bacterium]|nr:hypothetical protein [Chitinivibrionales bacterium]MBD3358602.1 hypothetical protein [Chitinivibrionales bacterium]
MNWEEVIRNLDRNIALAASELIAEYEEQRARRSEPISYDDVINLKIALNTAHSLDEFLHLM